MTKTRLSSVSLLHELRLRIWLLHLNNGHRVVDGLLLAGAGVDPVNEASDAGATHEDRKNDNQDDQHGVAAT